MANTTINSCYYQSVAQGAHWHQLPVVAEPTVVLLLQEEDKHTSALQACALLAAAWTITTLLPRPHGRQHFKTTLLKWFSGTDLLLCTLCCIMSLGSNGIDVASITTNLPMPSGSLLWQAIQFTRLTTMVWFINQLQGTSNKPSHGNQENRKTSTTQRGSQTESELIMDFISKSLDKFIIFAVLFASVVLFFSSALYLAVKSLLSLIYRSHFYKSAMIFAKQLLSHLSVSIGKHPVNRKLMFLVPTSLLISACVSSVQALDYV